MDGNQIYELLKLTIGTMIIVFNLIKIFPVIGNTVDPHPFLNTVFKVIYTIIPYSYTRLVTYKIPENRKIFGTKRSNIC